MRRSRSTGSLVRRTYFEPRPSAGGARGDRLDEDAAQRSPNTTGGAGVQGELPVIVDSHAEREASAHSRQSLPVGGRLAVVHADRLAQAAAQQAGGREVG